MKTETLKNKTTVGIIWSFSDSVVTYFIRFIIQIILARLLTPADYGIIGIVTVFIAVFEVIVDSGFSRGLIRDNNADQNDFSTVFYFNLIVSVLLYFILFISSDLISNFFEVPQLSIIIRVLSLVIIINSFGLIQKTILTKKLNFKAQTTISIVSSISSGIIAIIFAYMGYGVWSLVIRIITMQLFQALLFSISNRWTPSLVFSISSFKKLFNFGWKLLLSSILTKIYENIYSLIIGRTFSTVDLGFYTKANHLKDTFANSITNSIQKVSYPVLSSIQDDRERLIKGYKMIMKNSSFYTFPVMLGLAVVAPKLLPILLGNNWLESIPYFQILCFEGMIYPLNAINLNILHVKGRSELYLFANTLRKIIGIILIYIVLFSNLGMLGLIWVSVINAYISCIINSLYSKKLLSYSFLEQIKDVRVYFFLSFFMAFITHLIGKLINGSNIVILITQITIGTIIYIGISYILKLPELQYLINVIQQVLNNTFKKNKICQ